MKRTLGWAFQRAGLAVAALFLCTSAILAQPVLQIVSPAAGTVVSPGQAVSVNVQASGADFLQVALLGEGPLGNDQVLTSTPYVFSIQIPPQVSAGTYVLTAVGATSGGDLVYSGTISVDIERSDRPVSISAQPVSLTLEVGVQGFLLVTATYTDGTALDVTRATQIAYTSDTPSVAAVTGPGQVTAISPGSANIAVAYGGRSVQVPVTVPMPLTVLPKSATVNASRAQQFYGQVTMAPGTDPTVTWSLHPDLGSIDGTGLYTAPSVVDSEKRVVVTATSVADPTKAGSADVVLLPPISVSVDPVSATLSAGSTQYFNATVVNAADPTVNWSVSPAGIGTVDRYGTYTAPGTIASAQTATVTATSAADDSKTASAQIALVPSIALSAGPAAVTLYASQTQQFSATLSYTSYSGVKWSLSPNVGTIDWSGLYTAPSVVAYRQTVTVTATTGEGFKATATITLMPRVSPSVTTPTGLTASVASGTEIDLSWAASTEDGGAIAGYCIYRNGALAGTSTTTSYSDLGLLSSTSYTYTVVAYDATGTNSAPSASVSAATLAGTPVPGLVASYSFAEGSGTVVHDSSGNGNSGVIPEPRKLHPAA